MYAGSWSVGKALSLKLQEVDGAHRAICCSKAFLKPIFRLESMTSPCKVRADGHGYQRARVVAGDDVGVSPALRARFQRLEDIMDMPNDCPGCDDDSISLPRRTLENAAALLGLLGSDNPDGRTSAAAMEARGVIGRIDVALDKGGSVTSLQAIKEENAPVISRTQFMRLMDSLENLDVCMTTFEDHDGTWCATIPASALAPVIDAVGLGQRALAVLRETLLQATRRTDSPVIRLQQVPGYARCSIAIEAGQDSADVASGLPPGTWLPVEQAPFDECLLLAARPAGHLRWKYGVGTYGANHILWDWWAWGFSPTHFQRIKAPDA
jgi:hypothetical protein